MALKKRKNSPYWFYSFSFAGKRYRESTGERTKAAAAAVEAAALNALVQGQLPLRLAKKPTLREFSLRFQAWSENSNMLEPASRRYYRYGTRLLLFTDLADMPLDRITSEVVECTKFTRPVYDRRLKRETDELVPCSNTYTNQALRTLRVIMGKAEEWKVLPARPSIATLERVKRDKLIDGKVEIRLQHQMQAPIKNGRHNRMRLQAWIVLVCIQDAGMRPGEVFPMWIHDIRWEERRIWIPDGKTPNARRFVAMSKRMYSLLWEWCKGRTGRVFPSKRSKSGHLESIAKGFQAARERADVDKAIVPYSGRHTYGTYQMEATGNIFSVSRSMGHGSVKSMEDYQHPDTALLGNAIDKRNEQTAALFEDWHTNWHTTGCIQ